MKTNSPSDTDSRNAPRAALLWDESFLWGVMAYKALTANALPFDLIRSRDVKKGVLGKYSLLFIPGGWASNKIKALGEEGVQAIKQFVGNGGAYLGFCGGAGLATMDGIGLLPVRRRPTTERVPSFSGRIRLDTAVHPLWQGISDPIFHAWWPSQFSINENVSVLATYGTAMPDAFSSDVNVGDAEANGGWEALERIYRINLDPRRLLHEPAVLEGRFGKGRVVLSLVHFDTPDDRDGATVLKNLWTYLVPGGERDAGNAPGTHGRTHKGRGQEKRGAQNKQTSSSNLISVCEASINDLIALGQRNFLWYWRNPMLLHWRRGVRGLEFCSLSVMLREIAQLLNDGDLRDGAVASDLDLMRRLLVSFVDKAKHLLALERFAIQNSNISYEQCDDPRIQALREELFSRSKSHGGLFKELVDAMDSILYKLLKEDVLADRS